MFTTLNIYIQNNSKKLSTKHEFLKNFSIEFANRSWITKITKRWQRMPKINTAGSLITKCKKRETIRTYASYEIQIVNMTAQGYSPVRGDIII